MGSIDGKEESLWPKVVSTALRGQDVVLQVLDRPATKLVLVVESSSDLNRWNAVSTNESNARVIEITLGKSKEPSFSGYRASR
jgi:hypothetical protein